MKQKTLVIATHNAHKTEEIREILGGFFDEITDLSAFPEIPEADETGTTFSANAAIKALGASSVLPNALVLADDSGLEVDALNGEPGVYSARYSGENSTDKSNRDKLLAELAKGGVPADKRTARFRCVLSLARGGEVIEEFAGAVEGRITTEELGDGGFGYDSLFIPEGYEKSFGQLSAEIKNGMSHRGNALKKLKAWLSSR